MTLSEKEIKIGIDAEEQTIYGFKERHIKECFEKIEVKLLKKFKMGAVPIMKIIREEVGDKLI